MKREHVPTETGAHSLRMAAAEMIRDSANRGDQDDATVIWAAGLLLHIAGRYRRAPLAPVRVSGRRRIRVPHDTDCVCVDCEAANARYAAAYAEGHVCDSGNFDRALCADPCGYMHSYCGTCGERQDPCAHDAAPTARERTGCNERGAR